MTESNELSDYDEAKPLISYDMYGALPDARQVSSYAYAINMALDDIIDDDFLPEDVHSKAYDAKSGHRNLTLVTICGKELANVIFIPGAPGVLIALNDRERPYVQLNYKSDIPASYYENIVGDYFTVDTRHRRLVGGSSKDGSRYRVVGRVEGVGYLKENRWNFKRDFKAAGEFNILELSNEMVVLNSRNDANQNIAYPGVPGEMAFDRYVEREVKRMSYFLEDKNGRVGGIKEFERRIWGHIHAMGVQEEDLYEYQGFLQDTIAFFYTRIANYHLENIHKDPSLSESVRKAALNVHLGESALYPFAIGGYTFANMAFMPEEPGSQKGVLINMNGGDKPYVYVSEAKDIPWYYYNNLIDGGGDIYSVEKGGIKPHSVADRLSTLNWNYARSFNSNSAVPMDIEALSWKLIDDIIKSRSERADKLNDYAKERPLVSHNSFKRLPEDERKSSYDYAISRVLDDIVNDESLPENVRKHAFDVKNDHQGLALVTICGRSMVNAFFIPGAPGLLVNLNDRETPYVLVSGKFDIPDSYYENVVGDFFHLDTRQASIVGSRPDDARYYRTLDRAEGIKHLKERHWNYGSGFKAVGRFNVASLAEESKVVSSFSDVNTGLNYPGVPDADVFYRYVEKEIKRISYSTKEPNGAVGNVAEIERRIRQRIQEMGVKMEDLYKYEGLLSDAVTFVYAQFIYARLDCIHKDLSLSEAARERALYAFGGGSVLYPVSIDGYKFLNMAFMPEGSGSQEGILINLNGGSSPYVHVREKKDVPLYYYKAVAGNDPAMETVQLKDVSLSIDAAKLAKSDWSFSNNFNMSNAVPANVEEISEQMAADAGKRPALWANRFDSEKPLISLHTFELLPKGMQASSYSCAIHRALDDIVNDKNLPPDIRKKATDAKNNHQNLASVTIVGKNLANLFLIPGNPGLLVSLNDRINPYVLVSDSADIPVGYYENIVGDYFRREVWGHGLVVSGISQDEYRAALTDRILTHKRIDRKEALKNLKEGRWNYGGDFRIIGGYDINELSHKMVATSLMNGASKSIDYPGLPDDKVLEEYIDRETKRIRDFIRNTEKEIRDIEGLDRYIDRRIILRGLDPNRIVDVVIKDFLRQPIRHKKKKPRSGRLRVRYRDFITGRAQMAVARYRYDGREFDAYPLSKDEREFLYVKDNIFGDYLKYLSDIEKKRAGDIDAYFRLSARLSGGAPNTLAKLLDKIRLEVDRDIVTNQKLNVRFVASQIYELVSVPGIEVFFRVNPLTSLVFITSSKFVINKVLAAHAISESDGVVYDLRSKHDLINDISLSAMGILRSLTGKRYGVWRGMAYLPFDIRNAGPRG